ERDGTDESRRGVRHHGHDVVPAFLQPARDLNRLVGADPPGDTERYQHGSRSLFFSLDLLDLPGQDFRLRHRRLLVLADRHARHRSREELPGPRAGGGDELERIGQLAAIDHGVRVPFQTELTMVAADGCIRSRRARSAMTMLRSRSIAEASSSLTTTKSYSVNAVTSSRATCSRR